MTHDRPPTRPGFTLIELLVVVAILGIIIALILVAASDGVRRAEERQTQALITKLETALQDRVDALLATTPPINQTHRYLAAMTAPDGNGGYGIMYNSYDRRAQVIATLDYMKAELPDVFYLNGSTTAGAFTPNSIFASYPLNFAALPYPLDATSANNYSLPLGNFYPGAPIGVVGGSYSPTLGFNPNTGFNDNPFPGTNTTVVQADTGIMGASFTAAAGVYKNLYEAATLDFLAANPGTTINTKAGYDAADNDGNGLVDDMGEITRTILPNSLASAYPGFVIARMQKHTHKTARSEALYGILVEAGGPLGSAFNREDFTNREVGDSDGDGMLEFLDAWGEPLQFYRWPILYGNALPTTIGSSDSQKGFGQYDPFTPRQQDPLDPNQLLVSPAWWGIPNSVINNAPPSLGTVASPDFSTGLNVNGPAGGNIFAGSVATPQANAIMAYFKILIDPQPLPGQPANPLLVNIWDRSGQTLRREYFSKFLVLSAGPDKVPGTFQLGFDYTQYNPDIFNPKAPVLSPAVPTQGFPTGNIILDSTLLNWCESQAAQVELGVIGSGNPTRLGTFLNNVSAVQGSPTSTFLQTSGYDDITNHALTAPGAGTK